MGRTALLRCVADGRRVRGVSTASLDRNLRSRKSMRNEPRFNSPRNRPRGTDRTQQVYVHSSSAPISCGICCEKHHPWECELLLRAEHEDRKRIVVDVKLCLNCLQADYQVYKKSRCRKCRSQSLACTRGATAVVQLLDRNCKPHECRVLLDSGSEAHFLTIRFTNLLQISKQDVDVPISAVTNRLPSQRIPQEELVIPAGIQMADPEFHEPANIAAILDVEIFCVIMALRNFLRFLWYDGNCNLIFLRHRRRVFGVSSSLFILGAIIEKHALGLVCPAILLLRLLLQELWSQKLNWDEDVQSTPGFTSRRAHLMDVMLAPGSNPTSLNRLTLCGLVTLASGFRTSATRSAFCSPCLPRNS
ncbi:hypothetical protein M0804_013796 [Polistes exclamans]|nr:hypothetical protein M0804_013796 [Polistes exclamans]